jgi:hypothetical protein
MQEVVCVVVNPEQVIHCLSGTGQPIRTLAGFFLGSFLVVGLVARHMLGRMGTSGSVYSTAIN